MAESHDTKQDAAQPDYSKALGVYNKLKDKGFKTEADSALAGLNARYHNKVPPDEMRHGLEAILAKHEHSGAPNDATSHAVPAINSTAKNLLGLGAVVSVLLLASGLPPMYVPPLY